MIDFTDPGRLGKYFFMNADYKCRNKNAVETPCPLLALSWLMRRRWAFVHKNVEARYLQFKRL